MKKPATPPAEVKKGRAKTPAATRAAKITKKVEPKPIRPANVSSYTAAKGDEICERLSNGETMRSICRDADMPAWRTVYGWMDADESLSARIARAREIGADAISEDIIAISDEVDVETTYKGEEVTLAISATSIARNKLRVDARLKLLAKWQPKKYGDRTTIAGDADNPLAVITMEQITTNPASRLKIG